MPLRLKRFFQGRLVKRTKKLPGGLVRLYFGDAPKGQKCETLEVSSADYEHNRTYQQT